MKCVTRPEEKCVERDRSRWQYNMKKDLGGTGCDEVERIELAEGSVHGRAFMIKVTSLRLKNWG
jgi:hypothetical protein